MSDGLLRDWLSHDYTRKLRRDAEGMLAQRRTFLMSACAVSTDPKVTAALAEFRAAERLFNTLTKGSDHGERKVAGDTDAAADE